MICETYKGRKLTATEGRGNDHGYSRVTWNGAYQGKFPGNGATALRTVKSYIDAGLSPLAR